MQLQKVTALRQLLNATAQLIHTGKCRHSGTLALMESSSTQAVVDSNSTQAMVECNSTAYTSRQVRALRHSVNAKATSLRRWLKVAALNQVWNAAAQLTHPVKCGHSGTQSIVESNSTHAMVEANITQAIVEGSSTAHIDHQVRALRHSGNGGR